MPELDNFSLITLTGMIAGLLIWLGVYVFWPKRDHEAPVGIAPFLTAALSRLRKRWKIAFMLICAPLPVTAPLYAINLMTAADIVHAIWTIVIIYVWHRTNLPEYIVDTGRQTPVYSGLGIFIASIALSLLGLVIAVFGYFAIQPEGLIETLGGYELPIIPLEISETTLRIAGFGTFLALFSPLLARWVLVVPTVAIGHTANIGEAWKGSGPLFIPLALALWLAWLVTAPFHYLLNWIVWTSLPASPSNDVPDDTMTSADWPALFAYWIPLDILTYAYILLSVGIVSAAYRAASLPSKIKPLEEMRRTFE